MHSPGSSTECCTVAQAFAVETLLALGQALVVGTGVAAFRALGVGCESILMDGGH